MLQAMASTTPLNAVPEDEGNITTTTIDDNAIATTTTPPSLSHSDSSHTVLSLPPVPREQLLSQGDDALRLKDGQGGSDFRVNLAPSEEAEVYMTSSMFSGAGPIARSRSNSVNLPPASSPSSSLSSPSSTTLASASTSASASASSGFGSESSGARASRRIPRPDGGYSIINDPKLLARRQELIDSLDYFKRITQPRACPHCSSPVYAKEANTFDGVPYHKLCSQCDDCGLHLVSLCGFIMLNQYFVNTTSFGFFFLQVPATGTMHNNKLFCRKCLQKDAGIAGYGYGNNGVFL